MDSNSNNNQKSIMFYKELIELKRYNLINQEQYDELDKAYSKLKVQRRYEEATNQVPNQALNQSAQQPPNQSYNQVPNPIHSQTYEYNNNMGANLRSVTVPYPPNAKPIKAEKKVKNADEIRERNITWSLILGVIMLLTAGLILSTSNWSYMNDILKVISIASVSLFFLSLSWFTEKILKIKKTSFAFLILGSSFVPIIFVGIGFFELFGMWLSFYGEGKYVLGLLGSIISCVVYSVNAKRHDSKLFRWLSLITLSASVAFGLAAIQLNIDAFFLGIILYNALLLFGYYRYTKLVKLQWIIKEIPLFSQVNLILSSIFSIFFFNNYAFYSFNLIIISILFISLMYIKQSKHYHFAFTAFVTYGLYQLASNTPLKFIEEIIIASIALVFLGLQYYQKNNENLKKIFQWTCAIISFLAFIYISVESLFFSFHNNHIIMFISYIILTINFIYLTNITHQKLFSYLANIFAVVSIFQLFLSIPALSDDYFELFHFVLISGLFYVFYFKQQPFKWLANLKQSSLVVNSVSYLLIIFISSILEEWLTSLILSLLVAAIFYITSLKEKGKMNRINLWIAPILLILSSIFLYKLMEINEYELLLHLSLTSVCLVSLSFLLKKWNISTTSTFYVPQILYAYILLTMRFNYSGSGISLIVDPIILLLSLYMSYVLIKRIGKVQLWLLFTVLSSLLYFSLFDLIIDVSDNTLLANLYLLVYPIVFLLIKQFSKQDEKIIDYFYWTSLGFSIISNSVAVIITIFNFDEIPSLIMVISTVFYAYSALTGNTEIKVKTNLYLALITTPVLLMLATHDYFPSFNEYLYVSMFAGLLIVGIWFFTNNEWKKRIDWFVIPYLIISNLFVFTSLTEEFLIGNMLLAISIILTIYLVHKRKWYYVLPLPLLEMVMGLFYFADLYNFSHLTVIILFSIVILLLQFISRKTNLHINFKKFFDSYFIFSFILIAALEVYMSNQAILFRIFPSVLLAFILFMTIKRVNTKVSSRLLKTSTVISLFIIYYKVIFEFYNEIWSPIKLELLILPFIVAVIFLKKKVWDNEKVMTSMEWIVLLMSGILIAFDGIISSTVVDTIIMGIIGLLGIIVGMITRIKSYFFIGSGIVLITLYTQTRPLWSSMPWWIYLLVGGVILITIASIYEWQKQNTNVVKDKWNKIKHSFKHWK